MTTPSPASAGLPAAQNAGGAGPGDATARELVVALITIGRRLKPRTHDSRLDLAAVYLLHRLRCTGAMRVSELAKGTGLDASTVSRHLRNLEDAGYTTRAGDPEDRRAWQVRLTDQGCAFLEEAMAARVAVVSEAIAEWSGADRDRLTTLLNRLSESIEAAGRTHAAGGENGAHA